LRKPTCTVSQDKSYAAFAIAAARVESALLAASFARVARYRRNFAASFPEMSGKPRAIRAALLP
jgi:hypothetical protein